jgi:hypothetical protein
LQRRIGTTDWAGWTHTHSELVLVVSAHAVLAAKMQRHAWELAVILAAILSANRATTHPGRNE